MAFFEKLSDFAKGIGDKTNDAIETGKLNSKINSEKTAIAEDMKRLGECYYAFFAAGGAVIPEAQEICLSAKAHYDIIDAAQAEIEQIKLEAAQRAAEAEAAQQAAAQPVVEQPVAEQPAVEPPVTVQPAVEQPAARAAERMCPSCGGANASGARFCCHCGANMEPPKPQPAACPKCGNMTAPGTKFCPQCGNKMEV
ncbi:MAG: zinc ribbon domain-containing protein [Clostridia bacterium]|nr:zinc ribbon domain-containing protein [Clostridia bacterium]